MYLDPFLFSNFLFLGDDSVLGPSACAGTCPRAAAGGRPGSGGQHATGVELEGGTFPALWYLANIICQIFTEIFYKISELLEGLKQQ